MEHLELFQRFGLALAIGLLIGSERGWRERGEQEGERTAGVRTFALIGLLGGVWGALAGPNGAAGLALAFAVFSAVFAFFRWRELEQEGSFGATTVVAGMLAFALGAYAMLGEMAVAAAAGVTVTALLAFKPVLHEWLRRITWPELRSALVLLVMTFLLLPILPDRAIDPWEALNPRRIWLLTIMIAAISYAGYVAIKVAGEHWGLMIAAAGGGLVSSTAVTLNCARLAQGRSSGHRLLAAAAMVAGAVMMLRTLAVASAVQAGLLLPLLPPLLAAAVASGLAAAAFHWSERRADKPAQELPLQNPFEFGTVVKFGALLAAMLLASKVLAAYAGNSGVLALAAITGLADVDAITLSVAGLAGKSLDTGVAVQAVLITVASNTLAKAALAAIAGAARMGLYMSIGAAAAIGAGLAALVLA